MEVTRFKIGVVNISRVNLAETLSYIEETLNNNKSGYICVTNSRTAYIANQDHEYCRIQNNSLLTVPDGAPLVWIAHNKGYKEVERVSGKDLMDALFAISNEKNYSHYFFGSTFHVISQLQIKLKEQYNGIKIKNAVSPPFQSLEEFDLDKLAKEINNLKPTFFWCGLGAPKQERLISLLQPKLDVTICIGVGLAFEYTASTVKRAPDIMLNTGMEWLYRLAQQPKKIRRAIRPLFWIFLKLLMSYIEK